MKIMQKQLFRVAIEESVVQEFDVFANDTGEAIDSAITKYRAGEFVLKPCLPQFRQIAVSYPSSDTSEWMEF